MIFAQCFCKFSCLSLVCVSNIEHTYKLIKDTKFFIIMKSSFLLTLCKIAIFVIVLMSVISHVVIGSGSTPKKLQIGVKKRPAECNMKSRKGDLLHMHYTGTLDDGTEFDSSIPRGNPLTFTLGSGQVIKGWDQGLMGMCEGEQRKLVIPPELAYGEAGAPPKIPKSATLTFHVDLVKIERKDEF